MLIYFKLKSMRQTLLVALLATFALIASPCRAEIVTLNHDWKIQNVWSAEGAAPPPPKLDGVVKVGDVVHVSAWYDSDLADLTTPPGSASQQYLLPYAAAGMSFTVNGYVWRTSGYFHYDVMPSIFEATDGHYVGEIDWYARSWPNHDVTVKRRLARRTTMRSCPSLRSTTRKHSSHLACQPTSRTPTSLCAR